MLRHFGRQSLGDKLELPLMARRNTSKFGTNFTVSIEAKQGVTTGTPADS